MKPELLQEEERLARNLKNLSNYCRHEYKALDDFGREFFARLLSEVYGSSKFGCWPSHELLQQIQDDVLLLAECGRKRKIFPIWKAFEQLDKRMKKLRLKSRVTDLILRAQRLLPIESELEKTLRLVKAGDRQAQREYRNMLEDSLQASRKFAELLQADRQMTRQRFMAEPLVHWIITIRHPMAEEFRCIAESVWTLEQSKASRRRVGQRERVRRHRSGKKISSKSVTRS